MQPFGRNRYGPKIGGSTPFSALGAGSPSNTKCPGLSPTFIPSGILMHPAVWPQLKIGQGLEPLLGRGAGSPCNRKSPGLRPTSMPSAILIYAKCHLDPSIRLATINVSKIWGFTPFWGARAGSPSNTKLPGLRPICIPSGILIHAAIWPQQIWVENWGLCPFGGGGAGTPSNTVWPSPRPTCLSSFILIHSTVWPQYTNVTNVTERTDRQTGQTDNGLIA